MASYGEYQSGVTYLIPVYNPDDSLLQTIQSITKNDFLYEIIIINDFSFTGLNILNQVEKMPFVRVVENKQEKGISGALNMGLREVRSEYVARLDSGDLDLPNRITKQLNQLCYDNADLVVSDMLVRTGDNIECVVQKAYCAKVCGVIAPWSIVPHPTWFFRIRSLVHPYRPEYIRTEDYCFLAENNLRITVSHQPAIVYDGKGNIHVRNEIQATYFKVKTFINCSRYRLAAFIVGASYGLARTIRILIWKKKIHKTIVKALNFLASNLSLFIYFVFCEKNTRRKVQITTIIFSFDRPLQLFSLLDSICRYQCHSRTVLLVYRTSDDGLFNSYQKVFENFRNKLSLYPYHENGDGFKKTLKNATRFHRATHYLFYVDDQLVLLDLPEEEITDGLARADVFTYRLGLNTKYCYTLDKEQSFNSYSREGQVISWRMQLADNDINYPFSLDGTALPAPFVNRMVNWMFYNGPNSLESCMNYAKILAYVSGLRMSAPLHQKCVNFVLGRVQGEVRNRSLDYDIDYLHDLYQKGYRLQATEGMTASLISPHAETGFNLFHPLKQSVLEVQ